MPRLQSTGTGATIGRHSLVSNTSMPYHFEFDSISRILRCRLIERYDAQIAPHGGILDMSGVTAFDVSPQTIRELASLPPAMADASRPRCIVATSPEIFGMARMFELHGENTSPNLHLVRTQNEAWAILAVREPKFEPIELK
jgi:hypothetical protein